MERIPVIGFSAWSGTGKTTLIEKLVQELKRQGCRVAVIKHDAHEFEMDKKGKDSWRFTQAGADMTLLTSGSKTALLEQRPLSFAQVLAMAHDVDVVLVEGFSDVGLPCIGISRRATGRGFRQPVESCIAIATDEAIQTDIPCFSLEDTQGLAAFILAQPPYSPR